MNISPKVQVLDSAFGSWFVLCHTIASRLLNLGNFCRGFQIILRSQLIAGAGAGIARRQHAFLHPCKPEVALLAEEWAVKYFLEMSEACAIGRGLPLLPSRLAREDARWAVFVAPPAQHGFKICASRKCQQLRKDALLSFFVGRWGRCKAAWTARESIQESEERVKWVIEDAAPVRGRPFFIFRLPAAGSSLKWP